MNNLFADIYESIKNRKPFALCIVVDTKGSTPRKKGAKMMVYNDGNITGTIGGGAVEKQVINDALNVIKTGKALKKTYQLEEDLSMHCGGEMEIFIESLVDLLNLNIFGGGHVGRALAKLAKNFDFQINIFDWRDIDFSDEEKSYINFIKGDYFETIDAFDFNEYSFNVIVTPSHEYDEKILEVLMKKPYAYLGMIGSRRKIALVKKNFIENLGISEEAISNIDMPIGIPIKVETPEEIAVSILAKIIDVKNSRQQ
jgi:xanthine dehydrogenase accessory factor